MGLGVSDGVISTLRGADFSKTAVGKCEEGCAGVYELIVFCFSGIEESFTCISRMEGAADYSALTSPEKFVFPPIARGFFSTTILILMTLYALWRNGEEIPRRSNWPFICGRSSNGGSGGGRCPG
jgi:hypothetical protein